MQSLFRRAGLIAISVMAGAFMSSSPGLAAPQALALVATHGSTPLICEGGVCSAEFSAFCLQHDRASPPQGTAYRLQDSGTVQVTGVTQDGSDVTLDPAKFLKFHSLRTHVAVRISVDAEAVAEHGLASVAVAVGENVTLAPVPVAGDPNPQDEAGLAAAAGPLRAVGSRIVDSNETRMAAARLTSRLINDLEANAVPRDDVAQSLWKRGRRDGAGLGGGAGHGARRVEYVPVRGRDPRHLQYSRLPAAASRQVRRFPERELLESRRRRHLTAA